MSIFWSSVRWVGGAAAFFLIGPIAASGLGALRTASGAPGAFALTSGSLVGGLGAAALALGLAAACGLISARLVSTRFGFGVASLILAWAAWRTGATPDVVRDAVIHGSSARSALITLAIESFILLACVAAMGIAMFRIGKPSEGFKPIPLPEGDRHQPVTLREAFAGPHVLPAMGIAVVTGAVGLWLVGFEATKGQAVAAAVAAGVLGAMGAEFFAAGMNRAMHPAPVLVAMMLLGLAAPLTAAFTGGARLDEIMYAGRTPALAVAAPFDLAAGVMLGVPLGLTWARSLMEKKAHPDTQTA